MHPLYKILKNRPIKRGANATVWHARDEVLDREVALKELLGWASRPVRARACFQFAHTRRLRLNHPGLAAVHGADCDRGWIVLDCHQSSLADHSDPLAPETVRGVLGSVATTLGYLHEQGFVHGAVKPTNLFGTAQGQVLLADGLGVRFQEGAHPNGAAVLLPLDPRDGKYLAPECLTGDGTRIGPGVDLYALGLTGLELLLGGAAFAQLFPLVLAGVLRWDEWHGSDEMLPQVAKLLPEIPGDLADLITGLLCKDPAKRLDLATVLRVLRDAEVVETEVEETAELILVEEEQVLVAELATELTNHQTTEPSPNRRSWGWGLATLGTGLTGLGLGVAVSLFQPTKGGQASTKEPAELPVAQAPRPTPPSSVLASDQMANLTASIEHLRREKDAATVASQKAIEQLSEQQTLRDQLSARLAVLEQAVGAENSRAEGLANQLKSALEKVDAFASGELHERSRADGLAKQLKSAQEEQAKLRAELDSNPTKLPELLPIPTDLSTDAILNTLKRMGAKVVVETVKADKPILEVDFRGTQVSNAHLSLLAGLSGLRVLNLTSTQIGDSGLEHLAKMTNLESLHLFGTQVTDGGMVHLKGLTGLRTLVLSTTRVGDAGLAQLRGLSGLEALYLTNTPISDAGLAHVKGMTRLHTLHLNTTPVTDAGLLHLKDLSNLSSLQLSSTKVSDVGLSHLKGLGKLRELHLSFTRVTPQGAKTLQASLPPTCKIQE